MSLSCPVWLTEYYELRLLLLFSRLKSTCSLRLWCFTHHTTNSFGTSIMAGFIYLLLAYLHATSLLIFCFFSISPPNCPVASFSQKIKKYKIPLVEKLLPKIGCSIQSETYSPISYLSGRKAPHQLYTLSY